MNSKKLTVWIAYVVFLLSVSKANAADQKYLLWRYENDSSHSDLGITSVEVCVVPDGSDPIPSNIKSSGTFPHPTSRNSSGKYELNIDSLLNIDPGQYDVYLKSKNGSFGSTWSGPVDTSVDPPVPPSPINPSIESRASNPTDPSPTAIVNWTAPSVDKDGFPLTDLSGFKVYVHNVDEPCPSENMVVYNVIASNSDIGKRFRSDAISLPGPGIWYFWVSAYNSAGDSICSQKVQKTVE